MSWQNTLDLFRSGLIFHRQSRHTVLVVTIVLFCIVQIVEGKTIARWTFEEGTGLDVESGLVATHGSFPVSPIQNGVLQLELEANSKSGGALRVPDSPLLTGHDEGEGYTSLILEVDVRLTESGRQMQILRKTDDAIGYQLYIQKNGQVAFLIRTDQGTLRLFSKNKLFADGKWHHIEAVWDGNVPIYTAHLAVDGVVAWSAPKLGTLNDTEGPLGIGGLCRSDGSIGQNFLGDIDNVTISVNRPELLMVSGRPLPGPTKTTGQHLSSQPGLKTSGFVYETPVTPECHASTLVQRPDGTIVAAWFGGTHEGHADAGIWQSVLDGKSWSWPREVGHGTFLNRKPSATFNPVLFQYPDDGPLLLFYMGGTLDNLLGTLQTSRDGGRTWSEPEHLPASIHGPSKNKPVLLEDGTLVCPDNTDDGKHLKFDRTRDFGKTWLASGVTPEGDIDAIQPTILEHRNGRLQVLARSQTGSIVQSWSEDGGLTWSPLEKSSLPNNYSGIDAVTLADGRHLLVYNHTDIPEGNWGGKRTPLNVAVSDDGIHWQAAVVLEDESGEYSYPSVIQAADGTIHILYTWHRIRVKHAILDPAAFELRPIVDGKWPGEG